MSAPLWPFTWLTGCEPIVSFTAVQCYRIEARLGEGVKPDPVRITTTWFTADGELIAYNDPCAVEAEPSGANKDGFDV